ncbi:glyoxylate/hydroxypyruvate reductase HPR3-like [Humulus lupulus]|uniref:glyoxylate/hydroxypyruvate reductase HPR3-like n=1 Tax=Humulus lupulus TaxID=3486 RepID=UPI002B40E24A|nr:glyoxylate/hydroxypyruvate reductase HPR3-like [Humulus lupulus]
MADNGSSVDDEISINNDNHLPPILIHRTPLFLFLDLINLLKKHFRLLDPHQSPLPLQSFYSRHAHSVRALVVIGLCPVTEDTLRLLPSLKLVVGCSAGIDHIDLSACRLRGIAVTDAGNAFSEDVADLAVAMLFGVLRRVSAADRYVRSGLWPSVGEYPLGSKIGGKRVGIVGLGRIGLAVAKRLSAFGCRISYNSRKEKPSMPFPYFSNACELASENDILVVCCSLTTETHHIVSKDVMKALGKKGVIINVGRGGLVDEQELVHFLSRGELGGAGLDVFEHEPDVPKELYGLDNVVLSPHCAVITEASIESLNQLVLANLKAFFSDKPLLSPAS